MQLNFDIKLSHFIQNEAWNFPIPTLNNMMDICQTIPNYEVYPWGAFDDEIVWTLEDRSFLPLQW